ncbi:MAG: hypothetical protein NMNS01_26240 [Nitrosomonas sp.]|nr:MAG: hypothetical protein NMNS01_26240 [Nitrosomonas sp.]
MGIHMTQQRYDKAIALIDAANNEDPNQETSNGTNWPKELLYSYRMSDMLERYASDADDAIKLAVRAQHIQRWKSPRSDYPMDRKGYYLWRTGLYKFHADTVANLLMVVGYDREFIERVKQIVGKKSLKTNPEVQLLEDIAGLVFIEHYLVDFVTKHPEYTEEKWLDIIRKVWKKMSNRAHHFVRARHIKIPETLDTLIKKAVIE